MNEAGGDLVDEISFWMSVKKHFHNILNVASLLISLVGAALTIYFAVYYIPDYIKQAYNERVKTANKELIDFVKEASYNNATLSVGVIQNQIKGKEIKYSIVFPFTVNELLIEVEESFSTDYYIPLQARSTLIQKLDALKILNPPVKSLKQQGNKTTDIMSTVTAIAGILLSVLGTMGALIKIKKVSSLPSEEIQEIQTVIESDIRSGLEYERMVEDALNVLGLKFTKSINSLLELDFIFTHNNKRVGVECRFSKKNILTSAYIFKLEVALTTNNMDVILVTNGEMTSKSRKALDLINAKYQHTIHLIQGTSTDEIANQLNHILATI